MTDYIDITDDEADTIVDKAIKEIDEFYEGFDDEDFEDYYEILFDGEPKERTWDDDYPTSPWNLSDQIDWESIDYE